MVHSAFHIEPVLKKSASNITALEVWGSKVRPTFSHLPFLSLPTIPTGTFFGASF